MGCQGWLGLRPMLLFPPFPITGVLTCHVKFEAGLRVPPPIPGWSKGAESGSDLPSASGNSLPQACPDRQTDIQTRGRQCGWQQEATSAEPEWIQRAKVPSTEQNGATSPFWPEPWSKEDMALRPWPVPAGYRCCLEPSGSDKVPVL